MTLMLSAPGLVIILTAALFLLSFCQPGVLGRLVAAVFHQVANTLTAEACPGLDHCAAYLVLAAAAARVLRAPSSGCLEAQNSLPQR